MTSIRYTLKRRPTKTHGVAVDLYFRWQGVRYRPCLGYDLSGEEAQRRAITMIQRIQVGQRAEACWPTVPTLSDITALYWRAFELRGRVDGERPAIAIQHHLLPFFGQRPLNTLRPEDGLAYISARQLAGAAGGTIRREWQVFMRMLNLGVRYDFLDRNRLQVVNQELPAIVRRERVATVEELDRIHAKAMTTAAGRELWRLTVVALHTGLRQSTILNLRREHVVARDDGPWLVLPRARTSTKGNPTETPLNRVAVGALRDELPSVSDDQIFRYWKRRDVFAGYFWTMCRRAKVQDLHFHDLRHTFATWLQNLDVGYEVRQALLGHRMPGMTASYSHGGPKWDRLLREAVTRLEKTYPLSYRLSYSLIARAVNEPNNAKSKRSFQTASEHDSRQKALDSVGADLTAGSAEIHVAAVGGPRQPQQKVRHPRLGELFPEPLALDGKDQFVASTVDE